MDIVSPSSLNFPINLIGAGGIGSPTAMLLAKMGCSNISIMDFDSVEVHNLPNQYFRLSDVGRSKAEALAEIIHDFTGSQVTVRNERYENQPLEGVVIVAVDNMATRQQVWNRARYNMRVPLLIEARMGGQEAQVYGVNPCTPDLIRMYEKTLYTDDQAAADACTAQAIIYNTSMIAAIISGLVKAHANAEPLPIEGIVKLVDVKNFQLYN